MLEKFRRLPIATQMIVMISIVSITIIIIIIISNFKMSEIIKQNNEDYVNNIINQTRKSVTDNVESIDKLSINLSYDPVIQNYLNEQDDATRIELSRQVTKILSNMRSVRQGIVDFALWGENGSITGLYLTEDMRNEIKKTLSGKKTPYCTGIYSNSDDDTINSKFFVIGNEIYNIGNSAEKGKKIGTIVIVCDPKIIGSDIQVIKGSPMMNFYLIDRNKKIFNYSNAAKISADSSLLETALKGTGRFDYVENNIKYSLYNIPIESIGGDVVCIVNQKYLLKKLNSNQYWNICLLVISLSFISIPFMSINSNIVDPLKKLRKAMNRIKSVKIDEWDVYVKLKGCAEILDLSNDFNNMLSKIKSLAQELVETNSRLLQYKVSKNQTELAYLRSQINPHFLYNTLETISSIATLKGVGEISDVARALARVFRYSIKGDDFVRIQDEYEIIRAYVQIHEIRYNHRFKVSYDFADGIMDCRIPKMLLQPVVENAIYHGIEPKIGKSELIVSGCFDSEHNIVFEVKDNGVGFETEKLEKIQSVMNSSSENLSDDGGGLGIQNVYNRLRLIYAGRANFCINNNPSGGTIVKIVVPYRGNENV